MIPSWSINCLGQGQFKTALTVQLDPVCFKQGLESLLFQHGHNCLYSSLSVSASSLIPVVSAVPMPGSDNIFVNGVTSWVALQDAIPRVIWCVVPALAQSFTSLSVVLGVMFRLQLNCTELPFSGSNKISSLSLVSLSLSDKLNVHYSYRKVLI